MMLDIRLETKRQECELESHENNHTPTQKNIPIKHIIWTYIARPLFIAAIFLTLGFLLFFTSAGFGLAIPGGFLMAKGVTSTAVFILAGASLSLITHLLIHRINLSTSNELQKLVTSIQEGEKILLRGKTTTPTAGLVFNEALLAHIQNAMKLLDPNGDWKDGFMQYGMPNADRKSDFKKLQSIYQFFLDTKKDSSSKAWARFLLADSKSQEQKQEQKSTLSLYDTPKNYSDMTESSDTLHIIFKNIKASQIDPTYNPSLQSKKTISLSVLATTLFTACMIIMFSIYKYGATLGALSLTSSLAPWLLISAAALGFSSWAIIRYVLNNNSAGVYGELTALFGIAFILFLVPTFFSILSPAPVFFLIPFLFLGKMAIAYAKSNAAEKKAERASLFYRLSNTLLTTIKFSAIIGFLFLAFLSVATLFNMGGLGALLGPKAANLLGFSFNKIIENLGYTGFSIGVQWLSVFCIAIFSISSFIAFTLLKNFLERSPTTAASFRKNKNFFLLGALLIKLTFTIGIIVTLMAIPSLFPAGAVTSMLPIFLIIALVTPIFSGNANLPFLENFNTYFNRTFGLKLFTGAYRATNYFKREFIVLATLVCLLSFAYLPGVPTLIALKVLGVFIGMTMSFRWGTMIWRADNFSASATDYLQSNIADIVTPKYIKQAIHHGTLQHKGVHNMQMFVQYSPKQSINLFGHIQIRFKGEKNKDKNPKNDYIFSWGKDGYYGETLPEDRNEGYIFIPTPFKLTDQDFTYVNSQIEYTLDINSYPNTHSHKNYSALDNHCAHGSLQVICFALEKYILGIREQHKSKYQTQLDKLKKLSAKRILTPRTMFARTCDIFLEINRLERTVGPRDDTFNLKNDIERLDLKIAKAKAGKFSLWIPDKENNDFLRQLNNLRADKEKKLTLTLINTDPRQNVSSAQEYCEEKKQERENATENNQPKIPLKSRIKLKLFSITEKTFNWLIIKDLGWKELVSLLILLASLSLPIIGRSLLLGSINITFLSFQVSFALLGLPVLIWRAHKEWKFYSFKERFEWVLLTAGLLELSIVSIFALANPISIIFSPTFILPLFSITILFTSYLFGKHGLSKKPIERVWELLSRKDAEGNKEFESIVHGIKDSTSDKQTIIPNYLPEDEKRRLLLNFLNVAIEAMENELRENEKNSDKLTIWADGSEVCDSPLFKDDLANLTSFRDTLSNKQDNSNESVTPGYNSSKVVEHDRRIKDIFKRLESCKRSADNNSTRKKIAVVSTTLLFLGLLVASSLVIFNIDHLQQFFNEVQILELVSVGLTAGLLWTKGVMEWARQRATSYEEFIGKKQRPSQRITAERLVVWISNLTFLTLTIAIGFVLGVTSGVFISMAIIFSVWSIGQLLSSTYFQTWLEKWQQERAAQKAIKVRAEMREKLRPREETKGLLTSDSSSDEDLAPDTKKHAKKNTNPPSSSLSQPREKAFPAEERTARSYFNIEKPAGDLILPATDFAMRVYFVSAAVLATIGHRQYFSPKSAFNISWTVLGYLENMIWINNEFKKDKKNTINKTDERANYMDTAFDTAMMVVLGVIGILSEVGKDNSSKSVETLELINGTVFALFMAIFAMRAMKETWKLFHELSARSLLNDRLEKCDKIQKEINRISDHDLFITPRNSTLTQKVAILTKRKEQLLKEAVAIAKLKRNELLETDETIENIFEKYLTAEEIEENLKGRAATVTREEKLFVETLCKTNEEKFHAELVNLAGCLAEAICFGILALNPAISGGITLASFGGGPRMLLVVGGIIKALQMFVIPYKLWDEKKQISLARQAFLDNHFPNLTVPMSQESIPLDDIKLDRQNDSKKFRTFFRLNHIIDCQVQMRYQIAYYLRKNEHGLKDPTKFSEEIHADSKKEDILDAALDEFIILTENNRRPVRDVFIALQKNNGDLEKTKFMYDVGFREKAIVASSVGFFKMTREPEEEEGEQRQVSSEASSAFLSTLSAASKTCV